MENNINDILRAKRIVRQNGYSISRPARDLDAEREDRMNLIRAKRIVKNAGYSYSRPEASNDASYNTDIQDHRHKHSEERPERPSRFNRRFRSTDDRPSMRDRLEARRAMRRVRRPELDIDNKPEFDPEAENGNPYNKLSKLDQAKLVALNAGYGVQKAPTEPVQSAAPVQTSAPEAPAAPTQTTVAPVETPRKSRQEIYQDIASRYV